MSWALFRDLSTGHRTRDMMKNSETSDNHITAPTIEETHDGQSSRFNVPGVLAGAFLQNSIGLIGIILYAAGGTESVSFFLALILIPAMVGALIGGMAAGRIGTRISKRKGVYSGFMAALFGIVLQIPGLCLYRMACEFAANMGPYSFADLTVGGMKLPIVVAIVWGLIITFGPLGGWFGQRTFCNKSLDNTR